MGLFSNMFGSEHDSFAKLVRKRLQQIGFPGKLVYDAENFTLTGEGEMVFNLHNAFAEFQRAEPDQREIVLATFLRAWTAPMREPPDDFEDARHDLLPMLRSRSYFEVDLRLNGMDAEAIDFPYAILGEHLCASLVYDLPNSLIQVNNENLRNWGVSLYEALEVAQQNLLERTEQFAKIGDSLYAVAHGDSYDASRLVLTQVPRSLDLAGEIVAIAPNRETLLYASTDDDEALETMATIAAKAIEHERYVSGVALRLVEDEWTPWLPPADHPQHNAFASLRVQSAAYDYENQKTLLERELADRGEDVFVATYQAVRDKSTGAVETFCTWTKDVPTLLPKTDEIAFVALDDDDNPTLVEEAPWDAAVGVVGHLLEQSDDYPARYMTAGFPTDDELAAIAEAAK